MRVTLRRMMMASASVVALLLTMTATAPAQAPVPFIETFDGLSTGSIVGQGHWSIGDIEGTANVQTTNKIQGTKGATTSLADLTLGVDGSETNVWCQLYVKPTLYDDAIAPDAPSSDVSAAFYVNTGGVVKVWSGAGPTWQSVGTVPTDGRWLAFAVHSDYLNDKWHLYVSDDATYGTAYRRLNGSLLDFNSTFTGASLTEMTIAGVASIDAVALGKGVRAPSDTTGSNVIVTTVSLAAGAQTAVGLQTHAYGLSLNSMTQQLGDDMLEWLATGDLVTVRDTSNHAYEHLGSGWDNSENVPIYPGFGVWIAKANAGDLVMFMAYNTQTTHERALYGTVNGGMSFLAWDKPTISQPLGQTDAGFDNGAVGAGNGDRLYVFRGSQPWMLYWDNVNKRWKDGAAAATDRLTPGKTFWYYRGSDGGDGNWNLPEAQ